MVDPYCVEYGDPPFRSKSLHGNPGVARLQLGNAPLERRTDILIQQDVELRPEAFCGTLPHRKPAAGTAVKSVMRIVALLGLPAICPRPLVREIAAGSPRWASGSRRGSRCPAASRAADQETASRAPDPPDARRRQPNPRPAR